MNLHLRYAYSNLFEFSKPILYYSSYTLWKHQKATGFLMFVGVIEKDQWHKWLKYIHFKIRKKRLATIGEISFSNVSYISFIDASFYWYVK